MKHKIETPDGMKYQAEDFREAVCFIDGFCAALDCFAIWNDGLRTIGAQQRPISEYKQALEKQLRLFEMAEHPNEIPA